jgi:hypothetical protein
MRDRFSQFMVGRHGNDQLNLFLLAVDAVLLIVGSVFGGSAAGRVLMALAFALLAVIYFRMFSRNTARRQDENSKYLRARYRVLGKYRCIRERWVQRKDYKFFTCPSCKATLRVPRGQGSINIVCRQCGNSFKGKT